MRPATLYLFGKTNGVTHKPLNPGPKIDVLALDFLRIFFPHLMLLGINMPLALYATKNRKPLKIGCNLLSWESPKMFPNALRSRRSHHGPYYHVDQRDQTALGVESGPDQMSRLPHHRLI